MVEPPATIAHVFVADNNKAGVDSASGLGQKWLINDKHFRSIADIIDYFAVNLLNGNVLLKCPISKFSRREKGLSGGKGKAGGWQTRLFDERESGAGRPNYDPGASSSYPVRASASSMKS